MSKDKNNNDDNVTDLEAEKKLRDTLRKELKKEAERQVPDDNDK